MRKEYRNPSRCKRCGGKCCKIYLFKEGVEDWDEAFKASGATEFKPLFNPTLVHLKGNKHMLEELKAKGVDPEACKYLTGEGCLLPWDKRPSVCKEYRCHKWKRNNE